MSSYKDVIQKARKPEIQKTENLENQQDSQPVEKVEEVNLSVKVAKNRRQHWAAEAKRQGTTLTAAITEALSTKFGEPPAEE